MKRGKDTGKNRTPEGEDQDRIRHRAYELYVRRGKEPGHELEDWLEAEREVKEWRETQKFG